MSTVFFMIAGSNCGFLSDYPEADIVQGIDYQTGYFVNGKHVHDRQSINSVMEHHKLESEDNETFEKSNTETNS